MQTTDPVTGLTIPTPPSFPRRRGPLALAALVALLLLLLAVPAAGALWAHNAMRGHAESVEAAWAQVESNLQRRADLVPRLVEVVRSAMRHEAQVLGDVTRQRTAPAVAVQEALEQLSRAQRECQQQITALAGAALVWNSPSWFSPSWVPPSVRSFRTALPGEGILTWPTSASFHFTVNRAPSLFTPQKPSRISTGSSTAWWISVG